MQSFNHITLKAYSLLLKESMFVAVMAVRSSLKISIESALVMFIHKSRHPEIVALKEVNYRIHVKHSQPNLYSILWFHLARDQCGRLVALIK